MPPKTNTPPSAANDEPAWKQRAVERSTKTARLRAEQRVERFLDAARTIIADKGTTDFTVQEVVDRSRQSLRSFYQHFDGKYELLLALFEDALRRTADEVRAAAVESTDPLDRLRTAVHTLFALCRPDPTPQRPLFTDFAPELLLRHPDEVRAAHAPLLAVFAELLTDAAEAGVLRPEVKPRRAAALTMQTVMLVAQSAGAADEDSDRPVGADEIWAFCAGGFSGGRSSSEG